MAVVPWLTNKSIAPLEVAVKLPVMVTLPPPSRSKSLPQFPYVTEVIVTAGPAGRVLTKRLGYGLWPVAVKVMPPKASV